MGRYTNPASFTVLARPNDKIKTVAQFDVFDLGRLVLHSADRTLIVITQYWCSYALELINGL